MLFDALSAESFKFVRNRVAVFWTVFFLPIMALVAAVTGAWVQKAQMARINAALTTPDGAGPMVNLTGAGSPMDMAGQMVKHAGDLAGPMIILFALIGLASIWAGDYRFETWRLIIARNSRSNLLFGKVGVAAWLLILIMVLMLLTSLLGDVGAALFLDRPLTFEMDGQKAAHVFGLFGLSWLRLMQVAGLGLLTAVVTRSMLATLFVPLVVSIALGVLPGVLMNMGVMPDSWVSVMLSPGHAVDILSGMLTRDEMMAQLSNTVGIKAALSLCLWLILPYAGAFALFQRQDLSKE